MIKGKFINKEGFTLIEILVVIALIGISGVIMTEIFFRSIRGNNKAKFLAVIKQNGQTALDIIDKSVRNSDNVVCFASNGDTIVVIKNGIYSRYRFTPQQDSAPLSNGKLSQETVVLTQDSLSSACMDPSGVATSNLTDTNTRTGVSVQRYQSKPVFTIDKKAGFKDIVSITYQVSAGVEAPTSLSSQIDAVSFSTSIQLR